MNESPWISIIIPVYNAGQYFEECLQTVCGNTQLDAVFQKKLQAFANQYRYRHLEQIGASYSALNGIAVSFEAYFSFFRLAEYRVFRLELTNFLQKDCYQRYLKKKCPGAQYLNRNSKILIFLLAHRMYFLSWLLFGVGRKIKRTLDTVSKS